MYLEQLLKFCMKMSLWMSRYHCESMIAASFCQTVLEVAVETMSHERMKSTHCWSCSCRNRNFAGLMWVIAALDDAALNGLIWNLISFLTQLHPFYFIQYYRKGKGRRIMTDKNFFYIYIYNKAFTLAQTQLNHLTTAASS